MPKTRYPRKIRSGQSFVTIYRLLIAGKERFQLRWQEAGRMERRTYTDAADGAGNAQVIADRLASGDHQGLNLTPREADIYRRALGIAGSVPLDQWCQEYADIKTRLGEVSIDTLFDFYNARFCGKTITVEEAAKRLESDMLRRGLSPDHVRITGTRLDALKKAFPSKSMREVTEQDLRAFVDSVGGSPRTRKNYRDLIVTLWRWSRREGFLPRDSQTEAERVEAPRVGRNATIEIFTPDEMKKLLAHAPPALRPVLAICGFAGVRSGSKGEISRLRWENIRWDQGECGIIDVTESKTGVRRLVPIQANLRAWLEPFRGMSGPISAGRKLEDSFVRLSEKSKVPWKRNALRHSYGSYRVAQIKSVDQVALEMGNSGVIVRRHYLEAVHEDEATAWFGIMPG